MSHPLSRKFYNRPTLTVARELIGARLVRVLDGVKLVGIITETEGYIGEEDQACHARAGGRRARCQCTVRLGTRTFISPTAITGC